MRGILRIVGVFVIVAYLSFMGSHPAFSQGSTPAGLPSCTCSPGVEIQYPAGPSDKRVFAANCICGPQFCAATWNDDISLQCTPGAAAPGLRPDCADFTRMPLGKYGRQMKAGLFDVVALPSQHRPNDELEVRFDEINTNPVTNGPNGLHASPGSSFTYPLLFRTAQIALATYMGGGNYLTILTGKNNLENVPYDADPIHGKTINLTVQHADGIKAIRFPENEVLIFEVCAQAKM
ncbi:hypothetical protein PMI07_002064 [Rhizobium sp. CF080]|uniref:hypothetical protein n=1 Tax=Rhizobium sp. (strain CF080) TaxID=1144310 RepID=UPI000271CE04|nr:hypothetical protein [Rhizobium sp. CF080]EUB95576.1 hypothetical protein PMI07_002064 [Rhizobium sp. CF080]